MSEQETNPPTVEDVGEYIAALAKHSGVPAEEVGEILSRVVKEVSEVLGGATNIKAVLKEKGFNFI